MLCRQWGAYFHIIFKLTFCVLSFLRRSAYLGNRPLPRPLVVAARCPGVSSWPGWYSAWCRPGLTATSSSRRSVSRLRRGGQFLALFAIGYFLIHIYLSKYTLWIVIPRIFVNILFLIKVFKGFSRLNMLGWVSSWLWQGPDWQKSLFSTNTINFRFLDIYSILPGYISIGFLNPRYLSGSGMPTTSRFMWKLKSSPLEGAIASCTIPKPKLDFGNFGSGHQSLVESHKSDMILLLRQTGQETLERSRSVM